MASNSERPAIHGRGAAENPKNRFESAAYIADPDAPSPHAVDDGSDDGAPRSHPLTQIIPDTTRHIIASNDSPDVPFRRSINPYRGCEHGCIYCFARPTHEYLGYSAGLDFETKILVKHDAPELLRRELAHPRWEPQVVACSGVTDCYQPLERKLRLTRRCLEVFLAYRNPVAIVTKSGLIARDLDVLQALTTFSCVKALVSITTLDANLAAIMEPRASSPARRLGAIRRLAEAGVPVGVMVAPVIPALTDHEMPAILAAAKEVGASCAGFVPLRLPFGLKELFTGWLAAHFPDRQEKVLNRVRELRGGKLYDAAHFSRMRGEGVWADHFRTLFEVQVARLGLNERRYDMSTEHFRRPAVSADDDAPLPLFDA